MGTRSWDTVPGLNRHSLNVWIVNLSRKRLPVLWNIVASVTLPVAVSTVRTQTPLPVRRRRFASYGYSGKGALIAMDWATDSDIGTGSGILATSDCTGGRGRDRFFERCFLSTGGTAGTDSSGGGVDFIRCCDPELDVLASTAWLGSAFFSSVVRTGDSSSTGGVCSGGGAVFCFVAVASVCEFASALFLFDLEDEVIAPE